MTGTCTHTPNDSFCNDGLACNGVELCSVDGGCLAGPPVACSDGVTCTMDSCTEPNGTCIHARNAAACSDGQLCNGAEICDLNMGCKPGQPYVCPDDGVACSQQVCDPC